MKTHALRTLLALLTLTPMIAIAGKVSFIDINSDEESGISKTKTYTHLVDLGPDATAASINGVNFTSKGRTGANYTLVNVGNNFPNNTSGDAVGGGMADLLSDFIYGADGTGVATLTLTGLKEAHTYKATFFVAKWGGAFLDLSGTDGAGVTRLSRDGTSAGPDADTMESTGAGQTAAGIEYEYLAPASGNVTITFKAVDPAHTFHHYGFVNELVKIPGDTDGDGVPDVYETANGLNPNVKDAEGDLDGDGLSNKDEYTAGTKANNADTDGDGYNDKAETNTGTFVSLTNTGTNPLSADTDADGLPDGQENNSGAYVSAANPGSNPLKADTDGDGFDDRAEALSGSNPSNATSDPEAAVLIRTAVEFRFNAARGVSYRVESSTDLQNWSVIEAAVQGNGGAITRFYSTENQPIRQFRARRN